MTTIPPPLLDPIYLRRATPEAGPALWAMLGRCSAASLQARFLGATTATATAGVDALAELAAGCGTATAVEQYVDTVVRGDQQASVLAWQHDRVLAAGSILRTGNGFAEISLVVEDLWQDKGLGGLIAATLAEAVTAAGLDYLCAYLGTGNARARALITRFCPDARFLFPDAGVVDVVIPVAAIATARAEHQAEHDTWGAL